MIRYVDHDVDSIPDLNVIDAAFVVRSGFSYEREARILIHTHGTAAYRNLYGKRGFYGLLVKPSDPSDSPGGGHELSGGHADGCAIVVQVDPKDIIHQILLDSHMSKKNRQTIKDLVTKYGLADKLQEK